MTFSFACNRTNAFFKGKKAITLKAIENMNGEKIGPGSKIVINRKSAGLKVFFDIESENGIQIRNVYCENIDITE